MDGRKISYFPAVIIIAFIMLPRYFDQEAARVERRMRSREAKLKKKMPMNGAQVKDLLKIIKGKAAARPAGRK